MRHHRSRLEFPVLFAFRSHLGRNRALSLLTVLAIATSVALATGLEMATRGVRAELLRTADSLAGSAQLEISAGGFGLPERLLDQVEAVEGVAFASPMLLSTFRVPLSDGTRLGLQVLGVDLLSDREVRGYSLEKSDIEIRDQLRLISRLDSLIVTRPLADKMGLELGDALEVIAPGGPLRTVVRGILAPGGVADAYGSQIAAMDLYALQQILGREGLLDRIDIVPQPGVDLGALRARLESAVRGVASVRRPDARNEFADQVFGTVSAGIWAITCIGVLVASLLSYGSISRSVDARLRVFALLQAAGLEARRVRQMVRVDVALLTAIGTALGLGAGPMLASALFAPLSALSAENEGAQIPLRSLEPTAWTLLVAVGVGAVVSFAASLEPAWRATSHRPLDVLRESAVSAPRPARAGVAARCFGVACGVALLCAALPLPLPSAVRVSLIYLGGVGALIAASRRLVIAGFARIARSWQDALPSIGAFLGRSLTARPGQTALTAGVIAGIVSGLAAIAILLSSIERSFGDWVGSRYRGGLMITAGDPYDRAQRDLLSAETIRAIRATDGVGEVLESVHAPILFRGEEVILFARDMSILADRGQLRVLGKDWRDVAAELVAGEIAVSDAFQRRFGLSAGDRLTLDTAAGSRSFEIAAVVRDYYGPSGSLHLDIRAFDASWLRSGASSVVVWPTSDPEQLISRIRQSADLDQLLFFVRSDDYSKWVMQPFGRFIRLMSIVSLFTLMLGGLAIVALMTGAVSQRVRELAFLRIAGATSGLLSLLVVADSLIVAGYGVLSGLLVGAICSWPMCGVLTEWLGWTVEWHVSAAPLAWICGLALASAVVSALYPAILVRRVHPIAALATD